MPIPAGYTQLTTGFWRKDSDLSGPYAWTGAAFYLISTGVAGSGVAADYTQHPSGFWFKTADASGPYSYDGTDFWLAGNGGPSGAITVATVNVTSAINMANGSTFNLYNTADQTTNYERLRAYFAGGTAARLVSGYGGSATARTFQVGVAGTAGSDNPTLYHQYRTTALPFLGLVTPSSGGAGTFVESLTATGTASSGTQTFWSLSPTINQSGTAGYTALDINPTETATGSGTKLLQRWAVGGTAVGQLYNNGIFYSGFVIGANRLGLSSTIGGTADIELNRDAADTLALRRGAAAQQFRIYHTYTDASNYRRWGVSWNSSTAIMAVVGAGTGGTGNLAVGDAALATGATVGYFMIPSCAGAPTGVPSNIPTGQIALHYDSTNNKLYAYNGAWRSTAALT